MWESREKQLCVCVCAFVHLCVHVRACACVRESVEVTHRDGKVATLCQRAANKNASPLLSSPLVEPWAPSHSLPLADSSHLHLLSTLSFRLSPSCFVCLPGRAPPSSLHHLSHSLSFSSSLSPSVTRFHLTLNICIG